MDYIRQIQAFIPANEQERQDQKVLLQFMKQFPHNALLRENEYGHITSSGFVMNKALDKVLMVHHNIRDAWAWTGGHVDGEEDFLQVAIREAMEETGIKEAVPLSGQIASIDILPVFGHTRKGQYVNVHLHLSIAYILIADENEVLVVNKAENSGVSWFGVEQFTEAHFDAHDVYLYNKLIQRAKLMNNKR